MLASVRTLPVANHQEKNRQFLYYLHKPSELPTNFLKNEIAEAERDTDSEGSKLDSIFRLVENRM